MLTLKILKSGWGPRLIKQKISAYEALFLFGVKFLLWLVGCMGFEPRLAFWVKIQAPGGGNAGRAPSLHRIMPWFHKPRRSPFILLAGLVSRLWLVSTDRLCSPGPRQGPPPALCWCLADAPRRADASAALMLGPGPEKGRLQRCDDAWPRPREEPPPALCSYLVGALKRVVKSLILVFSGAPKRAAVRPMQVLLGAASRLVGCSHNVKEQVYVLPNMEHVHIPSRIRKHI